MVIVSCQLYGGHGGAASDVTERDVDHPGIAAERPNVTNEAKFYDDVIGAQIPEIVDVAASSGGDLGIDALRTKPKSADVSSRLLVVSCLKEEAGGGDVGVGAMTSGGDCGARAGVAGPDQRGRKISSGAKRRARREKEQRINELREAERLLAAEIRKLPPGAGEQAGLMREVLAASAEVVKALGGHEARSP